MTRRWTGTPVAVDGKRKLRPGFGKPVVLESDRVARLLTESARLAAGTTPDVFEKVAVTLVAELTERDGPDVIFD